jgi:predicted ester cyclase
MTTADTNAELIRRIVDEAWNEQNLEVVDELYSPEYVGHWFLPGGAEADRGSLKGFMRAVFEGFPDYRMDVAFLHADEEYATVGFTGHGTHEGEFMGIPADGAEIGRPIPGQITSRIEDGQIVEGWATWDALGMLQAVGAVPTDLEEGLPAED